MECLKKHKIILFILIGLSVTFATTTKSTQFDIKKFLKAREGQLSTKFFKYFETLARVEYSENYAVAKDQNCLEQLLEVAKNIKNGTIWALKIIDSWGNMPAGLLYGNLNDFGNFDECIRSDAELSTGIYIKGKYCTATVPISEISYAPETLNYNAGICIPAACDATTLDGLLKNFLNETFSIHIASNITLLTDDFCTVNENEPLEGTALAAIIIFSILAGICILVTLGDYFYTNDFGRNLPRILNIFSIRYNAHQVFRIADNSKNPNVISSLDGIRCLSFVWVVFGHDFFVYTLAPDMNSVELMDWLQTPFSMFLTQAYAAVDTFLFISAFLVTIHGLRELERTSGKLNIPLMWLHRYLRLTPLLGFAILVYLSTKYFSNGPYWKKLGWKGFEICRTQWWHNLLYIQNYASPGIICMHQTWYLAVDFQLYLFAPIMLICFWKWGKKAIVGAVTLLMLLWGCLFSTIMIKKYSMFWKRASEPNFKNKIYRPSHLRASPYIIGMIFGYYLHRNKGKRIELPIHIVLLGWIVSFALMITVIFSELPKGQMSASPLTTTEEAFFISLSRIAWPLALCWIVFACNSGYGGPVASFLEHPLWQPLARLSYCMYIFHYIVINTNIGRIRTNIFFSSYDLILRFWQDYGMSFVLGILMNLLVEAPLAGIIQCVMPARRKVVRLEDAGINQNKEKEGISNNSS